MFSVLFMSINIRIVFGLQILYLCIHFSFTCFKQCNNFDSGTHVATANQHDTLVELIHFINMSNNCKRQLHYMYFFLMTSDESFLSPFGGISNNSLIHLLQLNNNEVDEQESQLLKHSSYYEADQFAELTDRCRHNFRILTLNIESINAKFDELTIYIEELSKINFKFSIICLQETWLSDDVDLSIFKIAGYDCISQGKSCSKKGGLLIYIDNKFDSELVIKVSGGGLQNSTVIFNLYRPPKPGNDILKEFIEELTPVLEFIERKNANLILAGDTNINLLKMHEHIMYCDFFDILMAHNLCPQITLPTRFSNKNGTLIDNIFCKLLPSTQEHCSGILIQKLSDHLPCIMLLNSQTRKKTQPPKYMTIQKLTQHALLNIHNDLEEKNIYEKLDQSFMADVNKNYNITPGNI